MSAVPATSDVSAAPGGAPGRLRGWVLGIAAFCFVFALGMSADPGFVGPPRSIEAYVRAVLDLVAIYSMALMIVIAAARVAPAKPLARAAVLAAAVTVGVALGYGLALGPSSIGMRWRADPFVLFAQPVQFVAIGLLGIALFLIDERHAAIRRQLLEEQRRQAEIARAAAEAQLSLLRSQVEPHFLFNTLAHLRRLYATEPSAAPVMMQELVRYLGDARRALQRHAIPLAEDARLAHAYLNLQKVRMGGRLSFAFELTAEARLVRVPPMALTTLVENAIEHGLAPLPAGGAVHVRAAIDGGSVRIEVADTGRGLTGQLGTGVGLANLRARLGWLYGPAASLQLGPNVPRGVRAAIVLPHDDARGAS